MSRSALTSHQPLPSNPHPTSASSEPLGPGCHASCASCSMVPPFPLLFSTLLRPWLSSGCCTAHKRGCLCSPGQSLGGGVLRSEWHFAVVPWPQAGRASAVLSLSRCSLLFRWIPHAAASPCCSCPHVWLCCCSHHWVPKGPHWSQCTRGTTPRQSRWPSMQLSSADTSTC